MMHVMKNTLKKIGIIGGTFDPVHNGHLHLAEQAQKFFDLDRVIFIPAFRSPHKLAIKPEPWKHRVSMLSLALKNRPGFSIDEMEIKKNTVSYTIETLKDLSSKHPDWSVFLILGTDVFHTIDTWKNSKQILDFCNILVATRPGVDFAVSESIKNKLSLSEPETNNHRSKSRKELMVFENLKKETQVIFFPIPPLDISSKNIRQRIIQKEKIKNLLPLPVDNYIIKHQLYRNAPSKSGVNEKKL
tara:strand:+ start:430 stop:1161 length:732 start_codon:yes stop_codon:yes gene_type:complete